MTVVMYLKADVGVIIVETLNSRRMVDFKKYNNPWSANNTPWYDEYSNNALSEHDPQVEQTTERIPYHDWILKGLKEKAQWAYSSAAWFDFDNNQISFTYTDKLEGHNNTVFNSHHFNRVTDFYKKNARKEGNNVRDGIDEKAWKQCVQAAVFAVNKLYNWKGAEKLTIYTAIQNADNGEKGLMEAMINKGLTDGEKKFTAVDGNGKAIHHSKGDDGPATGFDSDPLKWCKGKTGMNGVGVFLVAALWGYHSLILIVDRRGARITYRLLDQHGNYSTGSNRPFDRLVHHTSNEVKEQLLQMAIDWTSASYLNSNYRIVKLKRD